MPDGVEARWADLTDPREVDRLLAETAPTVIIHLAAVIPPAIYRQPDLARRVNVDATVALLRAAEVMPAPAAFHPGVEQCRAWRTQPAPAPRAAARGHRSARRRISTARTRPKPNEHVRSSDLQWVILRLGGVMSVDPGAMPFSLDALFFESALPTDGRMHSVDVRDVAAAFTAATTADVVGEILLIGGDESHLLRQGDVGKALAAARGLVDVLPEGRPGDPDSDDDWFVTDWMDTTRAQQALSIPAATPGRTCSTRCVRPSGGAATRCGWSRRSPASTQASCRLPKCAGALRRSLGCHPGPDGRAAARTSGSA